MDCGVRIWTGTLALAAALGAGTAQATNGYFAHGYSASQRALGGAGTALTEDALIATINPAGAVWLGDRMDFNLSYFSPRRNYTAGERGPDASEGIFTISPDTLYSRNERYFIPGIGLNWALDDQQSVGLTMYGNGGMNTEYDGNTARFAQNLSLQDPAQLLLDVNFETHCGGSFGGGQPVDGAEDQAGLCGYENPSAGVDLIQLFIAPNYSRKLGEHTSVGVALLIAGQRFNANGLAAFAKFSNAPDRVTGQGNDYSFGYGGRVGFLTGAIPGLGIGASYQTRVRMQPFDKYAGVFAAEGDFDIPSNWNAGISVHLSEHQRLAIDYQHINYSEIKAVGNPLDPNRFINRCALPVLLGEFLEENPQYALLITAPEKDPGACLGSATGPGFGWRDLSVAKFGYQLSLGDFRLRAGYSRNRQPIPESEVLFNLLAPGVPQEHYTAGLSYRFSQALGFDLALMYAKDYPVRGKNPLSNINATVLDLVGLGASTDEAFGSDPQDQDLTLDMYQIEVTLGLSYYFGD